MTKPGCSFLSSNFMFEYISLWMHGCFCCVCFSFSVLSLRDWLRRTSPRGPILCRVGRKSVTIMVIVCGQHDHTVWLPKKLIAERLTIVFTCSVGTVKTSL